MDDKMYYVSATDENDKEVFEFTMTEAEMKEFLAPEDYAYVKENLRKKKR